MDIRLKVYWMECGDDPSDRDMHGEDHGDGHKWWSWLEQPKITLLMDSFDTLIIHACNMITPQDRDIDDDTWETWFYKVETDATYNTHPTYMNLYFTCRHNFEEWFNIDDDIESPIATEDNVLYKRKGLVEIMKPWYSDASYKEFLNDPRKQLVRARIYMWQECLFNKDVFDKIHSYCESARIVDATSEYDMENGTNDAVQIDLQGTMHDIAVFLDWYEQQVILEC